MKSMDMGIFNELSESIRIRMKSFFEPAHDRNWTEHKVHIDYDLWFIQSGIVTIQINGIDHTAGPGDVVFFFPGISYKASTTDPGCRFIYMHFDFGIGNQQRILSDFALSGIIPQELIGEEAAMFSSSYNQLKRLDSAPGSLLYLKACLTAAIAKIIALNGAGQYTGRFANIGSTRRHGQTLESLSPVFTYINRNLHQAIKINELAALVGISEKYFISYFKKALGLTPGQYIYQVKMNRARDYLYEKKYTIQQIADALGYPDPFTFSKAFKKYYHVPPSKFE